MSATDNRQAWLRRAGEAGFFVAVVAILWTVDTLTKLDLLEFHEVPHDRFRLFTEQVTSALVVLALIPAVAWWLTVFPLRRDRLAAAILGHVIGTGLFAVTHYFGMVLLRWGIFAFTGRSYVFSDYWLRNVVIEYQKDIKIYVAIVAIIAAYRYFRELRSQAMPAKIARDHLVVQTGTGESIVRREEIECLEAARNYVTVHTADREFLVRNTLANLEEKLGPGGIVRTHRSYLVNIDRIDEIRTGDSGNGEIRLRSGRRVPLSRSYRDAFRALFEH